MLENLFMARSGNRIARLHHQLDTLRRGQNTADDFYRLADAMADHRDFLNRHLERQTPEKRRAMEDQLAPAVEQFVGQLDLEIARAVKAGTMGAYLHHVLEMLEINLSCACAFTKIVI